jgi:hypothetical protein
VGHSCGAQFDTIVHVHGLQTSTVDRIIEAFPQAPCVYGTVFLLGIVSDYWMEDSVRERLNLPER